MRSMKYTNGDDFICLEDIREESSELSLVHVGRERCKPYHAFSGEREEYILHFVLSGQGFFSMDGNTWALSAGMMFLIRPHKSVVYCADRNEPWQYAWVGLSGSRVEHILRQCGFSLDVPVRSAPPSEKLLPLIDRMLSQNSTRYEDTLLREGLVLHLLALLCRHWRTSAGNQGVGREYNPYVSKAIHYISRSLDKGITVEDIADHLGISRTHLNSLFRKELNRTTQQFLMDLRLQRSAYLLANTELSVKEIAGQIGYTDALVFSKAFKRKYGLSPTNYRLYRVQMETRESRDDEWE